MSKRGQCFQERSGKMLEIDNIKTREEVKIQRSGLALCGQDNVGPPLTPLKQDVLQMLVDIIKL